MCVHGSRLGLAAPLLAVLAWGCGGSSASDASGRDAGPPDASALFGGHDGGLCVTAGEDLFERECCPAGALRPLPTTAKTVIDFSDRRAIPIGTCGAYLFDEPPSRRGFELPSDPSAYPVKLILPALEAADPACDEVCNADEPYTAFGIALMVDNDLMNVDERRGISFFVPSPWKFVSGGCGESCAYPCLGGYQEFGVLSCATIFYGDFGFATADPNAPSVEAVIELIDTAGEPNPLSDCCRYQ